MGVCLRLSYHRIVLTVSVGTAEPISSAHLCAHIELHRAQSLSHSCSDVLSCFSRARLATVRDRCSGRTPRDSAALARCWQHAVDDEEGFPDERADRTESGRKGKVLLIPFPSKAIV